MSLDPADWKLLRKEADEGFVLDAASPGFEVQLLQATIPRSADAPSLGLLLEEIAGSEDAGIVAIEGLVSGGNGEQASLALEPGDALVGAIEVGGRAVSLEGLNYDGVLEVLGGLDASKALELQVKRLVKRAAATVRVTFPQAEQREDAVLTLYAGTNLRRAMLAKGALVNDPLARRFDAGVGTGDCGGEGCCCTCAVEVTSGVGALSAQKTQEAQMLRSFPRWRLACKAVVDIEEDAEITIKVQPRAFDGFYGAEECDIDGNPLARDTSPSA